MVLSIAADAGYASRLTPAAGVEQPQRQPDRHDDHRAGQEDSADLTDVGKPELNHASHGAHGVAEQRRRIETESLQNDSNDQGADNRPHGDFRGRPAGEAADDIVGHDRWPRLAIPLTDGSPRLPPPVARL